MADVEKRYSYDTGVIPHFGLVDYGVFVITLMVSCSIGVFYAIYDRKKHTTKDFLLGGQSMNPVPVACSLTVTFMSAMTLLGNPAEVYTYDTMWWWLCVGMVIAMWMVATVFIPFFYNLGKDSVFEYLHMRFNLPCRIFGCILLIFQLLIYGAFLLYAPCLALNAVTGLHLWGSVIGMGLVVTFYTTLGGMKAVIWTDTFQAVVILLGLIAVLVKGSMVEGGFDKAWAIAADYNRINFETITPDPRERHSIWAVIVGGWAFWMYLYGVNQAQIQRCLSCSSVRNAQIALWLSLPGLILIVSLCCMIGVIMFAFYQTCHPISYGLISRTDQLVPLYVMDILGDMPGLPGLFVSCVISGSLSSLSSGLNALSAVTLRDILQQSCLTEDMSEKKQSFLSKLLVFAYGLSAIGLAYVASHLGSVLEAVYSLFGILNGPLLGVFTLGMFFPWSNKHGAMSGMVFALVFLLWIGTGQFTNGLKAPHGQMSTAQCNWTAKPTVIAPAPVDDSSSTDPFIELYKISYMYYTGLGMILVWIVGLPVSFCTGYTRPETLDPRLIAPIFDSLLPCFPERFLKVFRCGINHEGKYDKSYNSDDFSMIKSTLPERDPESKAVLAELKSNLNRVENDDTLL